jgi:hypothetical protein
MPFSPQIRSHSTSTGGWANWPVNTLPVGQDLLRHPEPAHRQRQRYRWACQPSVDA